jgi:hypothetical protein
LVSTVVLLADVTDLDVIPNSFLNEKEKKVFSFELDLHKKLVLKNIKHEIADDILNTQERLQIFDDSIKFLSWHSEISSKDFEFEGVNLLKIFDTHEFHSYLVPLLIKLIVIKKIIAKEQPKKIICSSIFENIVNTLIRNSNISLELFRNNIKKDLLWDKISVKYNIGKIPISLNFSKKNYLKIKKSTESLAGFFSNFWLDLKNPQKSIVLLEFNTELFSELLLNLKNYEGNIILINQRRSAVWSKKALDIVKKSNCKILDFEKILSDEEKKNISVLEKEYSEKLKKLWKNNEIFEKIFQIQNTIFWDIIKDVIFSSYQNKISYYIMLIISTKKLFSSMDVRCIATLNEVGETEKAFLQFNKKKIPTLLLEHGFIERTDETKRFDKLMYTDFQDKIVVWGNEKKIHLISKHGISPEKIIVTGSPRHDNYFKSRIKKEKAKNIVILLAPNPITEVSGLDSVSLEIKFENTVKKIIHILKKFDRVKMNFKLHQIQIKHNQDIKSIIQEIDDNIPIYSSASVIETINKSDLVLVISPESFATSTMLMESMILGKPTMNIVLDDNVPQFSHVMDNAVLTISSNDDLETNLQKFLFDEKIQKELSINADEFLKKFLSNRGTASEAFASILKSF